MPTQRPATIRQRTRLHDEAVEILGARYAEPIELEAVAKGVSCSPRQLQRAFSEIGGTTFRAHLTRVRMDRAARLLAGGDLPVREVAHAVGYRQPAQFAKAFRRRHGRAPAAFRAAWRRAHANGGSPASNGHRPAPAGTRPALGPALPV